MTLDFRALPPKARYAWMTQLIVPRPVAWVLTENENGTLNLAPFSYYAGIASDPPVVVVSIGRKRDGSPKDTAKNLARTGLAVVHVAPMPMLEAMNATSLDLPYGTSELDRVGLEVVPFEGFALPRVKGTPAAFGCRLVHEHTIGRQFVMFLEIERLWIEEAFAPEDPERPQVDARALNPVARLGAGWYAALGECIRLPRPKAEEA